MHTQTGRAPAVEMRRRARESRSVAIGEYATDRQLCFGRERTFVLNNTRPGQVWREAARLYSERKEPSTETPKRGGLVVKAARADVWP